MITEDCGLLVMGQQTVKHMDLFPVHISSDSLLLGESEREREVVLVSQYSTPAQQTVAPLLLKSKALSVGSFLWALFQVCLGPLPVKCKQFTDLLWLGRAKGFS